jgi:hypothetical protein
MKSSFELIKLLFENFSFNYCMGFDTPLPTPSKVLYLYGVSYIDGIKNHIISTGGFWGEILQIIITRIKKKKKKDHFISTSGFWGGGVGWEMVECNKLLIFDS